MMKQLLEQFLSEALSPETLEELSTTLEESFAAKVTQNREEVMLELAAQFAADREALVESVDTMVKELLAEHMSELADDINDFRDLEVEKAKELVEAKQEMAANLEKDLANLVESLDQYVEERLIGELSELKESIQEVSKNQLGLRIFEQFRSEIEALTDIESGNEAVRNELAEAKALLAEKDKLLNESAQALSNAERASTMQSVLSSLHGRNREIMETVLMNVPTEKLQEAYEHFIPRVLNESVQKNSEKEGTTTAVGSSNVLAEGKDGEAEKSPLIEGVVITGDDEEAKKALQEAEALENAVPNVLSESQVANLRKLAGIGF